MPIEDYNKASKEELDAFWRGDEQTRQRLYSQRMAIKEKEAEKKGQKVVYITPNSQLPEINITAKRKPTYNISTDDAIDYGIMSLGFIPGLDTFSDIVDVGNQVRLGNYGNAALSAGLAFIPGLSGPMIRKGLHSLRGIRFTLPKSKNNYYRLLTDLSSGDTAEEAFQDIIKTGTIRANPKGTMYKGKRERFIGPYFSKGRSYSPELNRNAKVAIIGKELPEVDWLQIGPHQSQLFMDKLGSQYTPLVNGVPNQSPSKYFEVWKRGKNPISKHFWFRQNISNSAPDPQLFTYPKGSDVMVHLDYGDNYGAFTSNGAYIEGGFLNPGSPKDPSQVGHTWFNMGKPYTLGIDGKPFTRAIIGTKENIPGLIRVRDSQVPLGQWDGKSGFVLSSEYATPEMVNMGKLLEFQLDDRFNRFKLVK